MGRRIDERRFSNPRRRSRVDERSTVRVLVFMGHADNSARRIGAILLLSLAPEVHEARRNICVERDKHISVPDTVSNRITRIYTSKVYTNDNGCFRAISTARD